MKNKIKVTGPKEVLEALAKKLKENGFQRKIYFYFEKKIALYIKRDLFYIAGKCQYQDNVEEIYNVLENWEYLTSLKPGETQTIETSRDTIHVEDIQALSGAELSSPGFRVFSDGNIYYGNMNASISDETTITIDLDINDVKINTDEGKMIIKIV